MCYKSNTVFFSTSESVHAFIHSTPTRLWPLMTRPNSPEILSMRRNGGPGDTGIWGCCLSSSEASPCPSFTSEFMKQASAKSSFPSSLLWDSSIILCLAALQRQGKTKTTLFNDKLGLVYDFIECLWVHHRLTGAPVAHTELCFH